MGNARLRSNKPIEIRVPGRPASKGCRVCVLFLQYYKTRAIIESDIVIHSTCVMHKYTAVNIHDVNNILCVGTWGGYRGRSNGRSEYDMPNSFTKIFINNVLFRSGWKLFFFWEGEGESKPINVTDPTNLSNKIVKFAIIDVTDGSYNGSVPWHIPIGYNKN